MDHTSRVSAPKSIASSPGIIGTPMGKVFSIDFSVGESPVSMNSPILDRMPKSEVSPPQVEVTPLKTPKRKMKGRKRCNPSSGVSTVSKATKHSNVASTVHVASRSSNYVASVIEYRSKKQIGVAVMSYNRPDLHLYQFADNPSYDHLMALLHSYDPSEILIPDTSTGSCMHEALKNDFQLTKLEPLRRRYFNEGEGALYLKSKGTTDSLNQMTIDSSIFLCLASSNCLIKYLEFQKSTSFASRSLQISFRSLNGFLKLDFTTIKNLELVQSIHLSKNRKIQSLFDVLNNCKTAVGERTLKFFLLQPLNDIETINLRLDAVEEFTSNEKLFFDCLALLHHCCDLDAVNISIVSLRKSQTEQTITSSLANILKLKQMLTLLEEFSKSLADVKSHLLKTIHKNLSTEYRFELLDILNKVINPELTIDLKKGPQYVQNQLAFSMKPGMNGLLDVARATYCECLEEIREEIEKYAEEFHIPDLKLCFSVARGYHFSIPLMDEDQVPQQCVQVAKKGKRMFCSTSDLISLDDRRREAFSDILFMIDEITQDCQLSLRKHISWLYKVSESIGYLDVLSSFANYVTLTQNCVRPTMCEEGPMAIKEGRHPVLERIMEHSFVPNDTFITPTVNLHIIFGINNSGKTTYLVQIGLLAIMAHIGCFVPAAFARFRCMDQLLTKLSTSDDIELNMSTFHKECRELAYIERNFTDNSLILMDETGRSTSSIEGMALSWSICERLLEKSAFSFVTTHFSDLRRFRYVYAFSVKSLQFKAEGSSHGIDYKFTIEENGRSEKSLEHYGIEVAKMSGIKKEVIDKAKEVSDDLRKETIEDPNESITDLVEKLDGLLHSEINEEEKHSYMMNLKETYKDAIQSVLSLLSST